MRTGASLADFSAAVTLLNVPVIDVRSTNNEKAPRLIFVIVVISDSELETRDTKLEFSITALLAGSSEQLGDEALKAEGLCQAETDYFFSFSARWIASTERLPVVSLALHIALRGKSYQYFLHGHGSGKQDWGLFKGALAAR